MRCVSHGLPQFSTDSSGLTDLSKRCAIPNDEGREGADQRIEKKAAVVAAVHWPESAHTVGNAGEWDGGADGGQQIAIASRGTDVGEGSRA